MTKQTVAIAYQFDPKNLAHWFGAFGLVAFIGALLIGAVYLFFSEATTTTGVSALGALAISVASLILASNISKP